MLAPKEIEKGRAEEEEEEEASEARFRCNWKGSPLDTGCSACLLHEDGEAYGSRDTPI